VIVMCGLRRKKNGRFDQKDDNLLNGLLVDDKRQIRRAESFTMNGCECERTRRTEKEAFRAEAAEISIESSE
jgi:hypothetical protein